MVSSRCAVRFSSILLERCWYKGAWSEAVHLGLMPNEWAKVNDPVFLQKNADFWTRVVSE